MLAGRIFVATPTYRGEVAARYVRSLVADVQACAAMLWHVEVPWIINDTLIQFARNKALHAFLASEATHLVFIDADLGWEPGALLKLMDTPGDIAGGLYRYKQDKVGYPHAPLAEGGVLPTPYAQVAAVPTGFMRISRSIVHRMLAEWPEPFEFEKVPEGTCGEDVTFCNRARRLGLTVYARTDIEFIHVGPQEFTGRYCDDIKE